jgi:hypothetical protein
MSLPEQSTVLSSWKDIARFMGKGVRTVQRWEHELGLPVRRPNGASQKSAVVLSRTELESWLETRFSARPSGKKIVQAGDDSTRETRAALRENIRQARELRCANLLLTRQIAQSLQRLAEQCDALGNLSNPDPIAPVHLAGPARTGTEAISLATGSDRVV